MAWLRHFRRKDQALRRDGAQGGGLVQIDRGAGVAGEEPENAIRYLRHQGHPGVEYPGLDFRYLVEAAKHERTVGQPAFGPAGTGFDELIARVRLIAMGQSNYFLPIEGQMLARNDYGIVNQIIEEIPPILPG